MELDPKESDNLVPTWAENKVTEHSFQNKNPNERDYISHHLCNQDHDISDNNHPVSDRQHRSLSNKMIMQIRIFIIYTTKRARKCRMLGKCTSTLYCIWEKPYKEILNMDSRPKRYWVKISFTMITFMLSTNTLTVSVSWHAVHHQPIVWKQVPGTNFAWNCSKLLRISQNLVVI